ncbi:MAG: hypothetical protein ACRC62_27640 [Microcoleus sp.]
MPVKKTSKRAKTGNSRRGRPSNWKLHPKTKLIRVPVKFAKQLLSFARYLDAQGIDSLSDDTPIIPDRSVKAKGDDLILLPSWVFEDFYDFDDAEPEFDGKTGTCQGWLWFLSDILSFRGVKLVATQFISEDGKHSVVVHFNACTLSPVTGYKVPVVVFISDADVKGEGQFSLLVDEIKKLLDRDRN